ncbi:hypothetical protein LSH36_294g03017 [Paralvinella palmiformis]|uniref:Iodothyronine deiodinase n=1 Tax=Paralvinella palmiformis TaxID=53620 RepID=A0AAD9JIX0_9ANNE|nr:hypothetical protein LSH36_294g03017 [Paralvinella palmiformis]
MEVITRQEDTNLNNTETSLTPTKKTISALKTLITWLGLTFLFVWLVIEKFLLRLAFAIPGISERLMNKIEKKTHMDETGMSKDDWIPTITSWQCLKSDLRLFLLEFRKKVFPGGEAYNASIVRLDGSRAKLLDYQRPGRPLVVNFGSCT